MGGSRHIHLGLLLAFALAGTLALGPQALARSPAASAKLDSGLQQLVAVRVHHRPLPGRRLIPAPLPVSRAGRVLVDVYVNGAMRPGADALRRLGMRVGTVSGRPPERVVEGWMPVDRLEATARLNATRAVMAVQGGFVNTGSVTSQGDAAHHGPQARASGPDGSGVPVGIMSDSINKVGGGVAASQATGDLPAGAGVQVLADLPVGGSDEGRAMAEIVYDTAPGVPTFYFATGVTGAAQKAANITSLAANGSKVIADDTVFLTEPIFQDGVVAQAVDQAKANGVAYFVSAGNRARQSWEGTYTPGSTASQNNFATSGAEDLRQTLFTIPPGQSAFIGLQWAEPWGAASTDMAIDVYQLPNETTPAFSTTTNNLTTGLPVDATGISNPTASALTVSIGIHRVAGTGAPFMKWIANTGFGGFTPEHDTASEAIDPDGASARGSLAVAAVRHSDPGNNTAESFSSRGPSVTRLFSPAGARLASPDVRLKPDLAAADGVSTSVPGFGTFFGTSAAAPSAAGVGAVLLSAKPSLPVDELYAILREPTNSVDCDASGLPDADCGAGFVLADGKLARVLDATPPSVTPVFSPAAPDGANGWYRGNVALSWAVSDPGSPVGSTSNCGPTSVTSDSNTTFTCAATSAGGTTNQPANVKRDSTPPTVPVFTGIQGGTIAAPQLPPPPAVGCTAADPTSGVDSCVISGYGRQSGPHTLTATATNDAGLTSSSTLAYSVVRSAAAGRLKLPKRLSVGALRRSGLSLALTLPADGTTVQASLLSGRTLIGASKRRADHGTARLTLRLNSRGRRLLSRARGAKLKLVVKAAAADANAATLTRTLTAGR
jgi:hypothetical protein